MENERAIKDRYNRKVALLKSSDLPPHRIEREVFKFEKSCTIMDLSEDELRYVFFLRDRLLNKILWEKI